MGADIYGRVAALGWYHTESPQAGQEERQVTLHVDFVQNDWAGAVQRIVGRVTCEHGTLHVKDVAPHFEAVIRNLVGQVNNVGDNDNPLRQLAAMGASTYVTTTGPHNRDECPFADGSDEIPMAVENLTGGLLIP